jgi:hypothetical protein
MHTLFDFTTRIKGFEYIIAITAIASFLLFSEFLKKKPFNSLMDAAREDIKYVKVHGLGLSTLLAAPFIGLKYIISLPFAFFFALATALKNGFLKMAGGGTAFSWRPMEAYFSGQKKTKKLDTDGNKQSGKK